MVTYVAMRIHNGFSDFLELVMVTNDNIRQHDLHMANYTHIW